MGLSFGCACRDALIVWRLGRILSGVYVSCDFETANKLINRLVHHEVSECGVVSE